ncbi:MAG: hypothetical protein IJD22_03125 [Clostridia bacterium]|nr:hypothetical protein [Clostridia bacterium]
MLFKIFNLQLFAEAEGATGAAPNEGAGGQAAADTGATAPAMQSNATDGAAQGADTGNAAGGMGERKPWEQVRELYKAEIDADAKAYAKEYSKDVVTRRLSKQKATVDEYEAIKPFLDQELYRRGLPSGDYKALVKAMETDKSMFRERAIAHGTTEEVEEALYNSRRETERANAENARLKAEQEEERHLGAIREQYKRIESDVRAIRDQFDPSFDLKAEMAANPLFKRYAEEPHNSLMDAYKLSHHDDIVKKAAAKAAEDAVAKTTNAIRSGTMPDEGAVNAGSPVSTKKDPSSLSLEEINQMIEEAGRGIKHNFS